ncbi:anaerobic ribonucleoside-triphosphate reductase-activating protein [Vibrio splendidus]|nr:anaerobic ribonucleoside-triphosphate reductase-activating protein [Vibrio splendidus]MCC4883136.1 anaerobic ribonucleoside-triphosphate reductase-activating protein [Vibrio splendidus]
MNYMTYHPVDLVNGEGTRCSLFVSGCEHRCKGCFSSKSHSFTAGFEFTKQLEDRIISDLNDTTIIRRGLSILGGEPLHPRNLEAVSKLVDRVRSECPGADIWLWTGYTLTTLTEQQRSIALKVDVLVDGKFEETLKDPSLKWRGSSNQQVIVMKSC